MGILDLPHYDQTGTVITEPASLSLWKEAGGRAVHRRLPSMPAGRRGVWPCDTLARPCCARARRGWGSRSFSGTTSMGILDLPPYDQTGTVITEPAGLSHWKEAGGIALHRWLPSMPASRRGGWACDTLGRPMLRTCSTPILFSIAFLVGDVVCKAFLLLSLPPDFLRFRRSACFFLPRPSLTTFSPPSAAWVHEMLADFSIAFSLGDVVCKGFLLLSLPPDFHCFRCNAGFF